MQCNVIQYPATLTALNRKVHNENIAQKHGEG